MSEDGQRKNMKRGKQWKYVKTIDRRVRQKEKTYEHIINILKHLYKYLYYAINPNEI